MQWKIKREREAEAPQSEPRKHWPAMGLNHEFWPPFMPSLRLIGCWGERGYGPAQRRESNCRLGPQPKQSEICVSCCCFFCPPFRHKFARPRVVGTTHHPSPTTHPPPLFFARSFLGRRSLSLCLSFTTFSAFEPLCLLPKSQSRFNARSFWSCSLPRRKW